MRLFILATFVLAGVSAALAQEGKSPAMGEGSNAIAKLLSQGYEIKASVPNGTTKFILFMQKGTSAYACEFFTVTRSRCESIN